MRTGDSECRPLWEAGTDMPNGRSCEATTCHHRNRRPEERHSLERRERESKMQKAAEPREGEFWWLPIAYSGPFLRPTGCIPP